MLIRRLVIVAFALAVPSSVHAQGLRDRLIELFYFADCPTPAPLCLNIADQNRRNDFVVSAATTNRPLIDYIGQALGASVANVPTSSASSGVFFLFEGGVPIRQQTSTGPIFAERAEGIGGGNFLVGTNFTTMDFSSLRGVPMNRLTFNFAPENTGSGALGDPESENNLIAVDLDLDINLLVAQVFFVYGLLDAVDLGLSIPIVRTSFEGLATGRIVPFGASTPYHFGTPTSPQYSAQTELDESAFGIGDIAARIKVNFTRNPTASLGALVDVRIPTGSDADLLGTGSLAVRALGIYSARWGDFAPHVNAGYLFWAQEGQSDALLLTVGFDHLLAPWATLAADLIGRAQVGESPFAPPAPIVFSSPFSRVVEPSNLPDLKDHVFDASFGIRVNTEGGIRGLLNVLVPLNDGGMRPNVTWMIGVEYAGTGPSLGRRR